MFQYSLSEDIRTNNNYPIAKVTLWDNSHYPNSLYLLKLKVLEESQSQYF